MINERRIPVIGICGWKSSGKTTLCERLIKEFTQRGLKVSSVKHSDHNIDFNFKTSDSGRHQKAGVHEVLIVGINQWALIHTIKDQRQPSLHNILDKLASVDLVIVEGYKQASIPKIETRRLAQKEKELIAERDPYIIAVAADHEISNLSKPVFSINSVGMIADFIDATIGPLKNDV